MKKQANDSGGTKRGTGKPRGRPPKSPDTLKKKVNLTLSGSVREKGDEVAYARGISLSQLVEELIRKEAEKALPKNNGQ